MVARLLGICMPLGYAVALQLGSCGGPPILCGQVAVQGVSPYMGGWTTLATLQDAYIKSILVLLQQDVHLYSWLAVPATVV